MRIFIYFILALGVFEIVSNIFHLSKGPIDKIGQSAKRQHQEISLELTDIHFFVKVIIMLLFGILFSVAGILFLENNEMGLALLFVSVAAFSVYGFLQAFYYRKPVSVWQSLIVYNIPLIVYLILK